MFTAVHCFKEVAWLNTHDSLMGLIDYEIESGLFVDQVSLLLKLAYSWTNEY